MNSMLRRLPSSALAVGRARVEANMEFTARQLADLDLFLGDVAYFYDRNPHLPTSGGPAERARELQLIFAQARTDNKPVSRISDLRAHPETGQVPPFRPVEANMTNRRQCTDTAPHDPHPWWREYPQRTRTMPSEIRTRRTAVHCEGVASGVTFDYNQLVRFPGGTGFVRMVGPDVVSVQSGLQWHYFGDSPIAEGPVSDVRPEDPFAGIPADEQPW